MKSHRFPRCHVLILSILLPLIQACAPAGEAAINAAMRRAAVTAGESAVESVAREEAAFASEAAVGEAGSRLAGEAALGISEVGGSSGTSFFQPEEEEAATIFLSKYCAGEAKALVPLEQRLSPRIARYFRSRLRVDDIEAADLARDVWIKVMAAASSGHCPADMSLAGHWLSVVTKNYAMSVTRSSRFQLAQLTAYRFGNDPLLAEESEALASKFNLTTKSSNPFQAACIEQVLTGFAPLEQHIVSRLVAGHSQSEVAELVGVSEATVSRRIAKMQASMEECL